MKILISGAGIAGPTLAYWLKRYGFTPTLVERAPGLRSGGYVIDFWGLGYDIAEMMGLFPALSRVGYHMQELRVVDSDNARVAGFGTRVFSELTGGRFITVGRSDLCRLIFETIQRDCDVIFDDCIVKLEDDTAGIGVTFERSGERRFDLVVGTDGLHSGVRRLAYGPQDAMRRASAIWSPPSKRQATGRGTSASMSFMASRAGRSHASPSTRIAPCSYSYSLVSLTSGTTSARRKQF